MRSTQHFSITLPKWARDTAVEGWLRRDVAAANDALQADPARAVSVDRVKARLAAVHKRIAAKA